MRVFRRFFLVLAVLVPIGVGAWRAWPLSDAELERLASVALEKGELSICDDYLQRLQQRRPRDLILLQTLADLAWRRNDVESALARGEAAAELAPRPALAFTAWGAKAFERHRPGTAERLYRRGLAGDSRALGPYSGLARLALILRDPVLLRGAIAAADEAGAPLEEDPFLLWAWIAGVQGEWGGPEAAEWLQHAAEAEPHNALVAAAAMTSGIRRETAPVPDTAESWRLSLARAEAAWRAGDRRTAAGEIALGAADGAGAGAGGEEAVAGGDVDPRTWLLRAELAAAADDPAAALELVEAALELDPLCVAGAALRGRLLERLGRHEEAARQLQQAARLDQLVLRVLQLLQPGNVSPEQIRQAAELADGLGHGRWAALARRVADRAQPAAGGPPRPEAAPRSSPLTVAALDAGRCRQLRRRFAPDKVPDAAVSRRTDAVAPLPLVDATTDFGLQFTYDFGHAPERWLMETIGGGIAVLDSDLDGWPDLFFAQGGTLSATRP